MRGRSFYPRTPYPGPRRWSERGFTLIEVLVVVVILALATAIVLPLLPSSDTSNLRDSARRLSAVIRYMGDRAVTTKTAYRMKVDLADSTISIKTIVNGEETAPADPFFSRKFLAEGVSIVDIEVPRLGKVSEGVVDIDFGVGGLGEATTVHLKGAEGSHFTVTALPFGGKVEALDGYQEMKL